MQLQERFQINMVKLMIKCKLLPLNAIELLLGSGLGLASVNTFLVALLLIARQDREIASLVADLVIDVQMQPGRSFWI